jgi:hypothetical protein
VSQHHTRLLRRSDRSLVDAALVSELSPNDLVIVEDEWSVDRTQIQRDILQAGVPPQNRPQSLHWRWNNKAPALNALAMSGFGITCEGRWQGVMLTKTIPHVARLRPDQGKPLVYLDYLETAPWNWNIPELGQPGRFAAVGSVLFWRAVKQSEEEGFHGRVGLHALPQAVSFYERLGMTPFGPDPAKSGLPYFELSRQGAQKVLSSGVQT